LLSITVPANVFSPGASFCERWPLFAGTDSFANAGGGTVTPAAPGTAVSNIVKMNLERDDFMMHLKVKLLDKGEGAIDLPLGGEKIFAAFLPG